MNVMENPSVIINVVMSVACDKSIFDINFIFFFFLCYGLFSLIYWDEEF
jgi:hypothetical protein